MRQSYKIWLRFFTLLIYSGLPLLGLAQQKTITGKTISEKDRQPLAGVTITVKGTTNKVISDGDGEFKIGITGSNGTLVFTYIGFIPKELPVSSIKGSTVTVTLQDDIANLNEVVVVGYGTQKKSDLTGSVSSITAEKINSTPSTNVGELLRGKAAGVQVTTGNARPGGSSTIRIRGTRSLSGGNNPLFVVDGSPAEGINDLNANDIQSVEVLKDASAQAIYGSRAANGVILVTTKRGKAGKTTVTYDGYAGIQQYVRNFDLFTPEEWANMRREAFRAANPTTENPLGEFKPDNQVFTAPQLRVLENKQYVNWEDFVLKDNPIIQQHNLSISGGNEKTKLAANMGYFAQDGTIPYSFYKRGSLRVNVDHEVSKKVKIGLNAFLSRSNERAEEDLLTILTLPQLAEPYDANGNLQLNVMDDDAYTNPLFNLNNSNNRLKVNRNNLTLFGDWNIVKGLTYRLNTNINYRNTGSSDYLGTLHASGRQYGGQAQQASSERFDYLIENILNYEKTFAKTHTVNLTAMQSVYEEKYESLSIRTRQIGNDVLGADGIGYGTFLYPPGHSGTRRGLNSYMLRARYGLLDRYLLTLTGRLDGSSVFGSNNKYAFFPSAAFAWKIKEEPFLKNVKEIDALKLRISYGGIGSQAISPFQTLALSTDYPYYFGDQESIVGFVPGPDDLPNKDLRWETTTTFDVGLDYSLFNGKIDGGVDYYITNTTDLLVRKQVPSALGFGRVWDNLGETENKGIEAFINANILAKKDFRWSIGANFTANRNKIKSIFGEKDAAGNPINDQANNWFIGEPVNVYYDYRFDGIWQIGEDNSTLQPNAKPGHVKVKDVNGDGTITPDDRVVISQDPDWMGSISTTLGYKGLELYAELNTVQGVTRRNPNLYDYDTGGQLDGRFNGMRRDYWTVENPSNTTFRPAAASGSSYRSAVGYQDASYIRLRSLTLSYTLPKNPVSKYMSHVKIYGAATNLFTKTDYLSYSPETNPNSYPEARIFRLGLTATY